MFASPEDIAGTTFWTLNLPLELRPRLAACLPEANFHFITIKNPIAGSAKRIQEASRSAILSFGYGEPPDLKAFLAKTKLPSFRLSSSFARIYGAGFESLGGVGFVLGRGAEAAEPDREAWLKANPVGSAGTASLRELYVSLGLSATNFVNAPPARLPPPAAPGDRPRYLVVPSASRAGMPAEARQEATRQLLAQARATRPDATFTVLSHVEPGQPSGASPVPGVPSLRGPYSPQLLTAFAGVVTDAHFAGLDALLRGLDVVCLGRPAWRLALPDAENPPAATLDAVFEAYFLAGTHYLLPKGQGPASPAAAFKGMAAALPVRRAVPAAPVAPPAAEAPSTAVTAPAKAEPEKPVAPVASPVPARPTPAPPGPVLVPVRAPAPLPPLVPVRTPERAPVRARAVEPAPPRAWPTPPGDPRLGDRYSLPAWAESCRLLARCPGRGRGEGEILALVHDLARSPLTAALVEAAGPFPMVPPVQAPSSANVTRLAEAQPEALHRLLMAELSQLPPGARIALLVGTDDAAVRAFARACAAFDILRVHVPAGPWQAAGGDAAATRRRTAGLNGLADAVGAWDPSHLRHASEIGYPAQRISRISTLPAAPQEAGILACVHDGGRDPRALLSACHEAAMLRGCGLVVHASAAAVAQLGEAFFTALVAEETVRLEWADTPTAPLHRFMAAAAVIVSDTALIHDMARASGRPALAILPDAEGDETVLPDVEASLVQRLVGLQPASKDPQQDDLALLIRFAISRALPLGLTPGAVERVLQRQEAPLGLLATSLSAEDLQRAHRYVLPMLGARDHVQVQGGPSRLAEYRDADVFALWGTRHADTSRELRWAARMLGREVLILEDGFIRSVNIGLSGEPGLSLILDDRAAYFDATRPSRLELLLNDGPSPNAAALARSQALMERISASKISKYNAAPYVRALIGDPARPKILLLDQREGDQSLVLGLGDEQAFERMVDAALGFAETHDILVKLHPDVTVGGRKGCLGPALMRRLAKAPGVYLVEQDVSPHSLIDVAEKVFTVTSGTGFEALMAGREVWCFGMPYYAGRGLTRDAVPPLRPRRARSLAEVFHAAWITLSRYYSPTLGKACEIEDLIEAIISVRSWKVAEGEPTAIGRRLEAPADP